MPMDSTDLKVVREILAAVRSGDEVTHKLLRALREDLKPSLKKPRLASPKKKPQALDQGAA